MVPEGVLFVSIEFGTAVHKCCCGCGNEVVTPLGPTDWRLTFDGESVSLYPSIGNWSFPCRSHYWIQNDEVVLANRWSDLEITNGRNRDKSAKRTYFEEKRSRHHTNVGEVKDGHTRSSLWAKLMRWWKT